jgi:hypothetical protein
MATTEIPGAITPSQKALLKKTWWKKASPNNNSNNYIPPYHSLKVTGKSEYVALLLEVLTCLNVKIDRGVFGIPLTESLRYAHSRISYADDRTGEVCNGLIPTVIAKCGAFLKEEGFYYFFYYYYKMNTTLKQ